MLLTAQGDVRKGNIHFWDQVKPVARELVLISLGSIVFAYGMNAVMIPAKFFSGGITGIALLIRYQLPALDIGIIYLLLNLPLILLGWITISRRFIFYTIYGVAFFSLAASILQPQPVLPADPLLAALLAGVICGAGSGLILRSIGSAGGLDILCIYLNKRYGLRVGTVAFAVNAAIVLAGGWLLDLNVALYSVILLFTSGSVINAVMSGFNARMSLLVVSDRSGAIAHDILNQFHRGVTFLDGQGAFSHKPKRIILTVATLTEVPRIKEMIFARDPRAFVVINKTLEVLGQRFDRLKTY